MQPITIEGFIIYEPTMIEFALINRLVYHNLDLDCSLINYDLFWSDEIIKRGVGDCSYLKYTRNIENLYDKVKNAFYKSAHSYKPNKEYVNVDKVKQLLNSNNFYEVILLRWDTKDIESVIQFIFENNKPTDIGYEDNQEWNISFLKNAFNNYTHKDFPYEEYCEENLIKSFIEIERARGSIHSKKVSEMKITTDIVNMLVDEFVKYLKPV